ncbi:restriction endonuclease subunit S [Tenacibaculum finnmarkense]|uniref:restriction endonuclease subunit S n=1 Tax=Tenacibaculum finnmarkense TaxID=2781243 RepID=UPI001E57D992|nr:restriction endonuclease subunit S [Tenacibaculum finnmarkense]MCD8423524.1 restriction endonuclease subunit S [Tenacibaculum finnmarkense genomovar ulcerans]MCG8239687.1 restriction endonuclease subunit S [Tenacibaculum finnmarkense genomovar ulcerans]
MSLKNKIPNGWVETTLGEVCEIKYGKDHKKLNEGKTPCLGSGGIMRYVDEILYDKPSVLIPRKGTLSNLFYIDKPFWTVDTLFYTKINTEIIDPIFLYFKLKTYNLANLNVGSAVPSLTTAVLNQFPFEIPKNIEEQKAIAKTLTAFDDKIENLQAQNNTLETTAQTIFKEWFGKYQIGDELPEGWRVGKLGDIAFNHSKSFKFSDKNVVFINTGDVSEGQFLHSNEIVPIGLPGQAKKSIELHDILYSEIRPKNKRFAFVDFETPNYVVSTKFMIIRPIDNFSPFILYFILKSKEAIDEFNIVAESRSGTFPQITFDSIKHYPLIIPPIEIQLNFEKTLKIIMDKQKNNTQQIETLKKTRDTLLPKLMNGELRVKI